MTRKDKQPGTEASADKDARIAELEQELERMRAALSRRNSQNSNDSSDRRRTSDRSGSMPRTLVWESWLVDTIKNLFELSTEGAIDHTLAELSQLLQLDGCCFHLMTPDRTPARRHSFWGQAIDQQGREIPAPWQQISTEECSNWLASFITASPAIIDPCDGAGQIPAGLQRAMHNSQTDSVAIIPIQRRTSIDGYICLFKSQPKSPVQWSQRELEMALAIGEVVDMVIESQSMTARLAERDTRFQYAMEASRDGLWDWNLSTNHIYFSHSFLRMLGYEDNPPVMNFETLKEKFIHPDDLDKVVNHYQQAIREKRDHLDFEYRMQHKNGDTLWVYSRTKFVERDSSGTSQRVVGINADITHFKESQEELLNAKAQADSANRTKSEFLNRMSHEIRTPMNAIIGMGHLMRDTSLSRNQTDYLGNIDQAAHTLLHIIDKVLDFAKIDSDKIILDNIHFDFEEVLGNLSQLTDADAGLKQLEVIFDTDSKVPRFLRGDAVRLNQVLYHLINNAIKFSDCGEIVVTTRQKSHTKDYVELEFCISDQGIGMSQAEVDNLFTPFTQADGSSSRRFGGTGLGLTICRHLVKLMDGHIRIDTEPQKGSKVTFSARFQHSHMGATTMSTQPLQFEGLRTLVVDDNDIARTVIARTTESLHLRCNSVGCAHDAIGKIIEAEQEQDPYQLVLMDWRMPDIDGLEASSMIKHCADINQPPAIVMISAYRRDEIGNDKNRDSIDGFINKPVSQSRLFNAIAEIFEQPLAPVVSEEPLDSDEVDSLLSGRHLLLAEDNIVNQKVAAGILKKKKVRLTIAANGREAVELMRQHDGQFDAVLMDIEMPDMDGFQATRAIRKGCHSPNIPIIALTAQALKGDRERCLNAGMNGYISKPVHPAKLYDTLAKLLQQEPH